MAKPNWYVFYTKSRHEKKTRDLLARFGFEVYLPLHKVMRQWSDRKKKVEIPLFNSYIFVNIEEYRIAEVLQVPGVTWNIRYNNKPAFLRESELETIKRFVATGLFIETKAFVEEFNVGDRVKVMDGPLKGSEGILIKNQGESRFFVALEAIGQVMSVQIDAGLLKRLEGQPH